MRICFVLGFCLGFLALASAQHRQRMSWRSWPKRDFNRMNMIPRGGRDSVHRTRRMGTELGGPHVCMQAGSRFCCPGWMKNKDGTMCTIAQCTEGACAQGLCQVPNLCRCLDGKLAPSCPRDKDPDAECNIQCRHGGRCVMNECSCVGGWTGPFCGQAMCGLGCLNGGKCIAPGRCSCVYGFTGMRCERDYRKGPCFLTRTNNTCINELENVMCTKLFCCATVGEGWGHPCEECPARVGNCTKGRLPPLCTDINECEIMPGLCEGGTCVNTDGSFRCDCPKGYAYDSITHSCVDVDECEINHVCTNGRCINNEGSFVCECPPSYQLSTDGRHCVSNVPGKCFTAIESGTCANPLQGLVARASCCCTLSGQETLGKCFAAVGQFPERCAPVGTPEFERDCQNVEVASNICGLMKTACVNGRCIEQPEHNSYFCECNLGYKPSADAKSCVDVDECTSVVGQGRNICGRYGTCLNTDGSYTCHCHRGFEHEADSMTSCVDIDECSQGGKCLNGNCVNTKGSFICDCHEGFRVSATQQFCDDINECLENQGLCEHGRCLNTIGQYQCLCNPGYYVSPDQKQCLDENECERNNMCANGDCVNMDGMFKCICHDGFKLLPSGDSCGDINECAHNPCINGECVNVQGSFVCNCHRFQILDESGTRCVLDLTEGECFRNVRNGKCRASNVLHLPTSRADCCCSVPGASSAWGGLCEPCPEEGTADHVTLCSRFRVRNVCDLLENPCVNGDCINLGNNEYRCECKPGFLVSEDKHSCIDFDECTQNLCSNGICRNTPGSYTCTCNPGYLLSGDVCEDIDECLSNPCTNARCKNEPGSYRCVCEEGAMLDATKHICHDVRVGHCWLHFIDGQCEGSIGNRLMTAEECCNSVGSAWGHKATCVDCKTLEFPCAVGYKLDIATGQCVDIVECDYGVCDPDADCVNTVGSFRCVCPEGLTLNADGTECLDLRVGLCYLTVADGQCQDVTSDSIQTLKRTCCCSVGRGWGDDCEECPVIGTPEYVKLCQKDNILTQRINECIEFPNLCENGVCRNTDSSFVCECNRGFALDESGKNCTDINECIISPGLCLNGVCKNIIGGFRCICDEGYEESGGICLDVNECLMPGYCTGGTCHNTEGSYTCTCEDGRSLNEDGKSCVDVDECALSPHLCAPNGRCENMLGYYMCLCDTGYQATVDAQDCIDVNECDKNNGGCHMGCTNTIGSYECTCDEGFVLTFDRHTCADRDECMEQMNRCDGGKCENTNGAFRCVCFDGFMATNDLQFCEDIDECAMNENACMHGRCHNTRGSYTCQCEEGYCVPEGRMVCVDENECEMSKHNCHVNADCNNTEGSYTCKCIDGFHGDGFMCHDDDECALGTHLCHERATCRNKLGTYTCDCNTGYHGDGFSCSDNDDCLEDETLCGPFGECVNVDGSFQCECKMGFDNTEDLKACKDLDECAIENLCVNGRCHNVPGNFTCECLPGFEKDAQGANCTDIDECEKVSNCINGICVNTPGKYECQCPEGFEPNPTGVGCVDLRTGDCYLSKEGDDNAPICTNEVGLEISKAECCCSKASAWGNPCEVCPELNTPEYDFLCPGGFGFIPNPITVLLEDINECLSLPGLCSGGRCINVFGSFKCECNEGYQLNDTSRTCEDVNECVETKRVCGAGECQNTIGGYNCVCPEGYKSIAGGRKCEDIREAACHRFHNATSGECSSKLVFNSTKKTCCCLADFGQGWNSPCEACPAPNTDEFRELCGSDDHVSPANICDQPICTDGVCVVTEDGYRCECRKGYHYNEDLIICEDDDECLDEDLCFENAECRNTPGSYTCACKTGFHFNEATETCDDIDECELAGICVNGDCTNLIGSYECDCNQGFKAINNGQACQDINECDNDNTCGHGECWNLIGSYSCVCDSGFEVSDNGDCIDINECKAKDQCKNGECVNKAGGFSCNCNDGYKVTPDGRVCIDRNECEEQGGICGRGTCQNMDGSYKCYCPEGYESPDGKSCEDINECEDPSMCKFGNCQNKEGSYVCNCPENFELSFNGKTCIDTRKEQCFDDVSSSGVCSTSGTGLVTLSECCCRCDGGGWGSEEDCRPCPANSTVEFEDLCPQGCGFKTDGTDINECLKNDPCINGRCLNQAGSFKCLCRLGFVLDESGVRCVDINECETGNPCQHGTCVNTEGMFECTCDDGYYNGPSITCLDIDECLDSRINQCAFRCENTDGSFHCACPDGFKLRADGKMCEDVDECASDLLNDCTTKGMTCKNIIGGYNCLCPKGYRRVGTSDNCVDINECEQARTCINGQCVNEEGSYMCQCNDGYEYDAEHKICVDNRQGRCYVAVHQRMCEVTSTTGLPFTKAECCCGKGKGWGDDCEECPHRGTVAFLELCPHGPGFQINGNDIDDCRVLPGLCEHGTCINTLGSYRCACHHGFEPSVSKQVCLDVNECLSAPSPCSFDCRNTEGSYECVCPKGYQIGSDTSSCVDMDECTTKRHNCQYICLNTVGSFKCDCPQGFVKEGDQCVDKNECVADPRICGNHGICVNSLGSYRCECPRGYRRGPGTACVDVDECGLGRGSCSNCVNVPGSYKCACSGGYASGRYGQGCVDINECVHSPCGHGQNCRNTIGSFQCGCASGLTKGPGGCVDVNECQMGGGSCNYGCQNSYRGFSCSCPRGFFKMGRGHCVANQRGGFRQHIPRFPPMFNGYGPYGRPPPPQQRFQPDTVCYNCMPGGDVPRRHRRSADGGRFIEKQDSHGRASINTSYPLELFFNSNELTHKSKLLELKPSLKQLRSHVRYAIVAGNDEKRFRLRHTETMTYLHFTKHLSNDEHNVAISSGVYQLTLRASTTLDKEQVKRVSLDSEAIERAIEDKVGLEVIIKIADP